MAATRPPVSTRLSSEDYYTGTGYRGQQLHSINEANEKLLLQHHRSTANPTKLSLEDFKVVTNLRTTLRVVSLIFSAAIVGILAYALSRYQSTREVREPTGGTSGQLYDVWPRALKLRPTYALLGAGAIGTVVSATIVLALFSKRVRWMTSKASNVITLVVSIVCTGLFVAVAVYYKLWDNGNANQHDLLSWTCTHKDYEYRDIDFGPFCKQMQFAWYASVVLAIYEFLSIVILVYMMVKMRQGRKGYGRV